VYYSPQVGQQVTSLPDYSLEVIGLPPDTSPDELKTYFEQWGDVAQVECARKCDTLIRLVLDRRKVSYGMGVGCPCMSQLLSQPCVLAHVQEFHQ
jgi:hypothetical protein